MTLEQLRRIERHAAELRQQMRREKRLGKGDPDAIRALTRHAIGMETAAGVWIDRMQKRTTATG